jgi:hypothetical protein
LPRNTKQMSAAALKRKDALEMRVAGFSVQQIANKHTRGDRSNAHKLLTQGISEAPREAATELREIELQRLDRMFLGLWAKSRAGDEKAVAASIRIMERRAKLLGLDAPAQVEQIGDGIVNISFDSSLMPVPMQDADVEVDPVAD